MILYFIYILSYSILSRFFLTVMISLLLLILIRSHIEILLVVPIDNPQFLNSIPYIVPIQSLHPITNPLFPTQHPLCFSSTNQPLIPLPFNHLTILLHKFRESIPQ
jgi:hypothetical protein